MGIDLMEKLDVKIFSQGVLSLCLLSRKGHRQENSAVIALFHPVRKPRCLPRVKLRFYRGKQRG